MKYLTKGARRRSETLFRCTRASMFMAVRTSVLVAVSLLLSVMSSKVGLTRELTVQVLFMNHLPQSWLDGLAEAVAADPSGYSAGANVLTSRHVFSADLMCWPYCVFASLAHSSAGWPSLGSACMQGVHCCSARCCNRRGRRLRHHLETRVQSTDCDRWCNCSRR